jgi:hypothetical protein
MSRPKVKSGTAVRQQKIIFVTSTNAARRPHQGQQVEALVKVKNRTHPAMYRVMDALA